MTTDIFIRTYVNDLKWLEHALRSIAKHVTGYRNIIIAIPEGQGHLLSHLTTERVIEVPDLADGYIGQQLTKMEAWKYTDADFVLFWDSDVIATQPIDINTEYFKDGKPILYKTRYSSIESPWKAITEKAVGFAVEWEYMRRMPMVYWRDTLGDACLWIENAQGVSLRPYLERQPLRHFSEFNAIGAFAEFIQAPSYHIVDTESIDMPPNKVEQFWSWGGITKDIEERINTALN